MFFVLAKKNFVFVYIFGLFQLFLVVFFGVVVFL